MDKLMRFLVMLNGRPAMVRIVLAGSASVLLLIKILTSNVAWSETGNKVAQTQKNLQDCINELKDKQAGWCELRVDSDKPGISNVWPEQSSKIDMVIGPRAILSAWGSAAFDSASLTLFFMGGGGNDYGGNEVYSFALKSGEWRRLTDPSPLNYVAGSRQKYRIPDTRTVPAASHVHDGLLFNQKTKTLLLVTSSAASGAKIKKGQKINPAKFIPDGEKSQQYEFNPSPNEVRNGLSPLTWRRIGGANIRVPRTAQLPDGTLLFGERAGIFSGRLDESGKLEVGQKLIDHGDFGSVNMIYDTGRDLIWYSGNRLVAFTKSGRKAVSVSFPTRSNKSIAFDADENLVFWDGARKVFILDPDAEPKQWRVVDWEDSGPSNNPSSRIYGKWVAIGNNHFIGVSTHKHGVWVYKHSPDIPGFRNMSRINIQKMLNDAPSGSKVRLPEGLYGQGVKIPKSLIVDFEGVELMNAYGGKALVVVESKDGPVSVLNLLARGKHTYATTGNLAGVRVSGKAFDVTLRNVRIFDTGMGVLTDNRGGRLLIRDSLFANVGSRKSRGLSHIVYAGSINELTLQNTVLKRSFRLGHILKSRALKTKVINSQLLGMDGHHSRVIDFPCGGKLEVYDSVLQNSSNADNSDFISVGVEKPANCRLGLHSGAVKITQNTIVFDKGMNPSDRPDQKRQNRLFTWRSGLKSLEISENVIVSPGGDYLLHQKIDGVELADTGTGNKIFSSRASAGLHSEVNTNPVER